LPNNLGEALAALRASALFRRHLGDAFVDYFVHIKEAELARFMEESTDQPDVTAWEQNEYFDLF
jgi:glutamine synthetase